MPFRPASKRAENTRRARRAAPRVGCGAASRCAASRDAPAPRVGSPVSSGNPAANVLRNKKTPGESFRGFRQKGLYGDNHHCRFIVAPSPISNEPQSLFNNLKPPKISQPCHPAPCFNSCHWSSGKAWFACLQYMQTPFSSKPDTIIPPLPRTLSLSPRAATLSPC